MAQFSYVGSLAGGDQPVLRRFVIKDSVKISVGDAVTQSSAGIGGGIMLAVAGVDHAILGIVHGFILGSGKPVTPDTGAVNAASQTPASGNDATTDGSTNTVYALVDVSPDSIYRIAITSGTLAITTGAAGVGGGPFCNLGTITSGAQVLSNTFTKAVGQFWSLGPDVAAPTTDVDVVIAQGIRWGAAISADAVAP